MQTLQS